MSEIWAVVWNALRHYPDSIAACGLFAWLVASLIAGEEAIRHGRNRAGADPGEPREG